VVAVFTSEGPTIIVQIKNNKATPRKKVNTAPVRAGGDREGCAPLKPNTEPSNKIKMNRRESLEQIACYM